MSRRNERRVLYPIAADIAGNSHNMRILQIAGASQPGLPTRTVFADIPVPGLNQRDPLVPSLKLTFSSHDMLMEVCFAYDQVLFGTEGWRQMRKALESIIGPEALSQISSGFAVMRVEATPEITSRWQRLADARVDIDASLGQLTAFSQPLAFLADRS